MSKKLINFSSDFVVPEGVETVDTSSGLVKWGKNNLYPQYLNYLYYSCAVHQGIINGKVSFIVGGGLDGESEIINLFEPIIREISRSIEISDTYYLECRLDYTTKSKIEKVTLIPFEKVRVTESGAFLISDDWSDSTPEFRELRSYSKDNNDQSFIYEFKVQPMQYQLGGKGRKITKSYYTEPSYKAGIKSILTDIEGENYRLSSFVNSFSIGTIVSFNNGRKKDDDDRRRFEQDFREGTTGSDNASGVFLTYHNGKDTQPTVLQLSGDQLHERYTSMSADVRDNIMKAHGVVSPTLFGFQTGGSFNQSEMDIAYILMKDNYFLQRQKQILEGVNFVDSFNGGVGEIKFKQRNPLDALKKENRVFKEDKKEEPKKLDFDDIIEVFSSHGQPTERDNFLMSESLNLDSEFKDVFDRQNFNAIETQVLNLISDGNSFDKIAKALNYKPIDLVKIYDKLIKGEKITKDGKLTKQGKLDIVKDNVSKYEIRYTYEVKAGYGEKLKPTTRDFCRAVIGAGRMYTREDIGSMSSALGLPKNELWRYRGGWYHNPDTKKNEPSCRHEWKQNLRYIGK